MVSNKSVFRLTFTGERSNKMVDVEYGKSISDFQQKNYETVFSKLHAIMMEVDDKYIKSFLGVKEYVETHLEDKIWDVNLAIHANCPATTLKHKGRLNAPTVDKIATFLPSSDVITKKHKRYVTVNYRQKSGTNQLEFIPDYHRSCDPLQYPLIFPYGQDGWHCDLEHTCLQHVNF
jgi:hypothetical protein